MGYHQNIATANSKIGLAKTKFAKVATFGFLKKHERVGQIYEMHSDYQRNQKTGKVVRRFGYNICQKPQPRV